jgi:hypothetical protein
MSACKITDLAFIPCSAASFFNYAVGPWVSVAGREAALARGNPAKKEFSDLAIDDQEICLRQNH